MSKEDMARLDGLRIEARTALAMLFRLRDRFLPEAAEALFVEIDHYRARIRHLENRLNTPSGDRMTHMQRGWNPLWQCPVSDWLRKVDADERSRRKGAAA